MLSRIAPALWLFLCLGALSLACGMVARVLCFEDTTLGGWLPFALLTAGPFLGCCLGVLLCILTDTTEPAPQGATRSPSHE